MTRSTLREFSHFQSSSGQPFVRGLRWAGIYLGAWTLVALYLCSADLWFMRKTIGPGFSLARLGMFLVRGYGWALVSLLTILVARRFPLHQGITATKWLVHGLAGFVITLGGLALDALEVPWFYPSSATFRQTWWLMLTRNFHFSYLVYYWGVIAIHEGIQLLRLTRAREQLAHQLRGKLTRAQVDALKMHLSPHFLFNTLNTVAAQIHSDPEAADHSLLKLASLLRISLSRSHEPETSLSQELAFIQGYLDIEQQRFGDRLRFKVQANSDALGVNVPTFILQPLVENAIKHAVAPRAKGATIILRARREAAHLVVEIEDDGPGFLDLHPEQLPAFIQTRQRMEQQYGLGDNLQVLRPLEGGALVRLVFPFESPQAAGNPQEQKA